MEKEIRGMAQDSLTDKVKKGIALSLNEGFEFVKRLKKRNKETREAQSRHEFPTYNTEVDKDMPDQMGQQKYLVYALSFIRTEKPIFYNVLVLRMKGQTCKQLSRFLNKQNWNTTEASVKKIESEAIKYVQAKIDYLRKHGIPIFKDPAPRPGIAIAG